MKYLKKIIIALSIAYLISAICLLLLAFLIYKFDISDITLSAGIVITYLLSNILGGLIIGKSTQKRKFAWGLLMGFLYIVGILIASALYGNTLEMESLLLPLAVSVVSSMFGAIIS